MTDKSKEVCFCHLRKEQSGLKSWLSGDTHQGSPSITDRGIAPHTQQWRGCGSPRGNVPMRWKHCPELKRKLNSKSRWWGQAAAVDYVASSWRGSSGIFFSFFFLRMISVSRGSGGPSVQPTLRFLGLCRMLSSPSCGGSREWHLQL